VTAERGCVLCGGELPRDRATACFECVPVAVEPLADLPRMVVGPSSLLTKNGTLCQDPAYGRTAPRPSNNSEHDDHGLVYRGTSQRQAYARWLATLGLSAREIAGHFDGVTVRQVGLWAGDEIKLFRQQRDAILASSDLVADVRKLRAADLPSIVERREQLRADHRRDKLLVQRIVLDECERLMASVRSLTCEHCGGWFVAKRRDAKYCSDKCSKAAYRANVRDKSPLPNTPPQSKEIAMPTDAQLAVDAERLAEIVVRWGREMQAAAVIAARFRQRFPADPILTAAVDEFLELALGVEEKAA
jgi:hypothetical protein